MTTRLNRRQMLFAAAVPFSAGAVKPEPNRTPSLVELAPLLATFEAEADEYKQRLGTIQWRENVVAIYARCDGDLAEQLLNATGRLTDAPIALSWARNGAAWFMFIAGEPHQVVDKLAAIAPANWNKVTDRCGSVMWTPGEGGAK